MLGLVWCLCAGLPVSLALPNPNEPIDPTKRARVSTSDAMRPTAMTIQGDGVIGNRVVPSSKVQVQASGVQGKRAPIDLSEGREKVVIETERRNVEVRNDHDRDRRASDLPASIPRLTQERFQRILRDYEEGRVPARDMLKAQEDAGVDRVSIDEINRYANPRRALEAQGIPVRQAGAGPEAKTSSTPAPLPQNPR